MKKTTFLIIFCIFYIVSLNLVSSYYKKEIIQSKQEQLQYMQKYSLCLDKIIDIEKYTD